MIGYIEGDTCVLKDIRPIYFVPYDGSVGDTRFVLVRATENGPVKRKHVMCDLFDLFEEPPNKKSKFDQLQNLVVNRVYIESEDLHCDDDPLAIFHPMTPADFEYDSEDEAETSSEFEEDGIEFFGVDSGSDSDCDLESYESDPLVTLSRGPWVYSTQASSINEYSDDFPVFVPICEYLFSKVCFCVVIFLLFR